MKKFKKILLCMICSIFLVSIVQVAAINTDVLLNIETNKNEYDLREQINVNITAKNETEVDVNDLEIETICPKNLEVLSNNDLTLKQDNLKSGQSTSYQFELISKEKKEHSNDIRFKYNEIEKNLNDKTFYNPIENYDGKVVYSSSNENIAIVDEKGNVSFVRAGIAIISANILEDNEYYQYSFSYVLKINENKDIGNKKQEQLIKFENDKVEKKVTDEPFTNPLAEVGNGVGEIKYYSSNEDIAEVDINTGKVTIKSIGNVKIIAVKLEDDNYNLASTSYELIINDNIKSCTSNGTNNDKKDTKNSINDIKSKINTGDDNNFICFVGLFLISFIILIFLSNKKYRKKIFIFLFISSLCMLNIDHVFAIDKLEKNKQFTVEKEIKVNNQVCIIKAICNYTIDEEDNKFVPKDDASDYYNDDLYTDLENENYIECNPDTLEEYYNNEVIVTCNEGLNEDTEKSILSLLDGSYVVGKNKYTQTYQIRFNKSKSYEELLHIISKLKMNGYKNSHFNRVLRINYNSETPFYPDDERWKNDWSNYSDGKNWGMEAINAPLLWKYYKKMSTVNVGVMDNGVDDQHNDLKNVVTLLANNPNDVNHGTHVCGIIGAEFNNSLGVCGVCPTARINCIPYSSITSTYKWTFGITELILKKCKVINVSMGYNDDVIFAASQSTDKKLQFLTQEAIKATAADLEYELMKLSEQYDFIICNAAGNANNDEFIKMKESITGYARITQEENTFYVEYEDINTSETIKRKLTELDKFDLVNTDIVSKTIDAKWASALSIISNQKIKDRILIVGASQLNEDNSYIKAKFSNGGDRVDVLAPGVNIYSTISDNEYDYYEGTSMASPHVAGLASMLYAINSNLTGEEIKKIIVESANIDVLNDENKKMINAWNAYKLMTDKYYGKLSGRVIDERGNPIENANVHIQKKNIDTLTDENGKFIIDCPVGIQEYIIQKDGYENYIDSEKILTDTTTIVSKDIVLSSKKVNADIGIVGKVVDTEGHAIENVKVDIFKSDGNDLIASTTTDKLGKYKVILENGNYDIHFTKENYETFVKENIMIFESIYEMLDVTLQPPKTVNEIWNVNDFQNMNNSDQEYVLMTDLNLTTSERIDFNGILNGNNHTVTIDLSQEYGLFNKLGKGAKVYNLNTNLGSVLFTGKSMRFGSIAIENNGLIEGCKVGGNIYANSTPYTPFDTFILFGGVSAHNNDGVITKCSNDISTKIKNVATNASFLWGGIAGTNYDGKISKSIINGDFEVIVKPRHYFTYHTIIGGIVGMGTGSITDCIINTDMHIGHVANSTNSCFGFGIFSGDEYKTYNNGYRLNTKIKVLDSGYVKDDFELSVIFQYYGDMGGLNYYSEIYTIDKIDNAKSLTADEIDRWWKNICNN